MQLFLDIFDRAGAKAKAPIPPPLNIAPRIPEEFELRVIVWDTREVVAQDVCNTGEEMSDQFVRCNIQGYERKYVSTDTHYRSLNGEGNFNWRMKFKFHYLAAEEKIVLMKKESMFSWDKTATKVDPILCSSVWDADLLSSNGMFELCALLVLLLFPLPSGIAFLCISKLCLLQILLDMLCVPWWETVELSLKKV